jgi:hypothetical protein
MRLKVDFYSKQEVSVDIEVTGLYNEYSLQHRNILLLSTFLVQTYRNFGVHPVGKLLSYFLRQFSVMDINNLINNKFSFPNAVALSSLLNRDNIYLGVDLDMLESMILNPMPKLVPSRWPRGKHRFTMNLSPCRMDIHGFTAIGIDLNYYAFQMIFAAIHAFGKSFQNDQDYLSDIYRSLVYVSNYYHVRGPAAFVQAEQFSVYFINRLINES